MSSVNRLTSWDKDLFGKELRFRFGRASGYLLSGHAQKHEIFLLFKVKNIYILEERKKGVKKRIYSPIFCFCDVIAVQIWTISVTIQRLR